jgi:hypothetical protein
MEEIAAQVGHKRIGFNMTLRYAPHSSDYLVKSAAALEKLLQDVIAPDEIRQRKTGSY